MRRPPKTVLALVVSAGCTGADADTGFVVRDSAGVRIAENEAPAWRPGDGWTVDPTATVEIGVAEGEEPYQLFRVFSAVRLPDGGIAVGNSGSHEVRLFDASGRFLRSVGRLGSGPGEFGEFSALRLCLLPDGGLAVEDGANDRVNLFGTDLEYAGQVKPEALPDTRPPSIMGCFGDGSFATWTPVGTGTLRGRDGDIIRGLSRYHRHLPDGSHEVMLAEIATQPRVVNEVGEVTIFPFIPLSAAPSIAAGSDRFYVGAGDAGLVEARALDGARTRIAWPARGRHAVAAVYERYTTQSLEDIPDQRRPLYARLYERDMPLPDSTPAYRELLADSEGNLWVERYRLPWEETRTWEVFNADGRWLGAVDIPSGLTVFEIGADFVLGRHLDELGVERVRLHALVK